MLAEINQAVKVELGIRLRQDQARQHEHDEADDGVAHGHALVAGVGRKQRSKLATRNLHGIEQGHHDEDGCETSQGQLGGSGAEQQMIVADGHTDKARRGEGDCL
ncbi:unknown [Eggerthella sp. CAG:209]|nr:unknown [Eggerthella sp. CAG:209]